MIRCTLIDRRKYWSENVPDAYIVHKLTNKGVELKIDGIARNGRNSLFKGEQPLSFVGELGKTLHHRNVGFAEIRGLPSEWEVQFRERVTFMKSS